MTFLLPPLLWCSLNLKGWSCSVGVSSRAGKPTTTPSLHFEQCGEVSLVIGENCIYLQVRVNIEKHCWSSKVVSLDSWSMILLALGVGWHASTGYDFPHVDPALSWIRKLLVTTKVCQYFSFRPCIGSTAECSSWLLPSFGSLHSTFQYYESRSTERRFSDQIQRRSSTACVWSIWCLRQQGLSQSCISRDIVLL